MLQILLSISIEIIKLECVGYYQKRVGTRLRNSKKKEKGLGGRCCLTDTTIDQLQNYEDVGNLQDMKSIFQFQCFMLFQMRTVYATIHIVLWVQIVGANTMLIELISTQTYKSGPGLPRDIICKIRPIYIFKAK